MEMISVFDLYILVCIIAIVITWITSNVFYGLQNLPYIGFIFNMKPFNCILCTTFWASAIYLYRVYGFESSLLMAFPTALIAEYIFKKLTS